MKTIITVLLVALLCAHTANGAVFTTVTSIVNICGLTAGCDLDSLAVFGLTLGPLPGANDDVVISGSGTGDFTLNVNKALTYKSLTVGSTGGATAILNVNNGNTLAITEGLTVTGGSSVNLKGSGQLTCSALSSVQGSSAITVGDTNTASAKATFSGGLNIVAGGTVTVNGGSTLEVNSFSDVYGTLTLNEKSIFNAKGNATLYKSSFSASGTTNVQGALKLSSSSATLFTQAKGSLVVVGNLTAMTVTLEMNSTLTGNGGAINGNVIAKGNIAIGSSPGTQYVRGDFTMSDTTRFELEIESDFEFDRLFITGNCHRDGILYAHFLGSYQPDNGQEYSFMTHTSADSTFNVVHGNYFEDTFFHMSGVYGSASTGVKYNSAGTVVVSFTLLVACLLLASFL